MKKFVFVILFCAVAVFAAGQSVNNVTVSGGGFTVTAAIGDAQCVFTGPHIIDSGTIDCYRGKLLVLHTLWHAAVDSSVKGGYAFPLHTIDWILTHVSAGSSATSFAWSISIDSAPPQTGVF